MSKIIDFFLKKFRLPESRSRRKHGGKPFTSMKKRKSHARAPSETQITISLPQSLKDELSALACEDDRSRSKWVVRELSKIVRAKKAAKIAPIELLRAAEAEGEYPAKKGKRR